MRIPMIPLASWLIASALFGQALVERHGLRLIVVASEAEALGIRDEILAGDSFSRLARERSIDATTAAADGYLGTVVVGDLRREFQDALEGLERGEVSPVTRVDDNYVLLQLLAEDEQEWTDHHDRGTDALGRRRYPEAVEAFEAAVLIAEGLGAGDRRLVQSLNGLAEAHRLQGAYPEAETLYARTLSIRWGAPSPQGSAGILTLLDRLADVLILARFKDSQFEAAVRAYSESMAQARASDRLYLAMSEMLLGAELTDEAEMVMLSATEAFPDSRELRYELGEMYRRSLRYEEAVEAFTQASRMPGPPDLDPEVERHQVSVIYEGIASAHTALNRFDDAIEARRTALEIRPDRTALHLDLARLLSARGRVEEAAAEYAHAIDMDPNSASAHYGLARQYLYLRRLPEAEAAARKALELDPARARARFTLGTILVQSGQPEAGRRELEDYQALLARALAEDGGREADAVGRAGAAQFLEGRQNEAIELLLGGVASYPQAASLYEILGVAQSKLGAYQAAIETLEASLDRRLGPAHLLHKNLSTLQSLVGNLEAGRRHRVAYLQAYDVALDAALR